VIGRMEKFFIAGPKKLAPTILLSLQRAAVVHIDPLRTEEIKEYQLSQEEETLLRRWEAIGASADHALRLLGLEPDQSVQPFAGDLEEAEVICSPFEQKAAVLVKRREQLRSEIELVNQYREMIEVLAEAGQDLDQSLRLAVLPFLFERRTDPAPLEQELSSTLNDRFLLVGKPVGSRVAAMLIVLKREVLTARGVLSHHGLAELPRPGEYARMNLRMMASRLSERSRLAPQELAGSEEELSQLTKGVVTELQGLWNKAKDESVRLRALKEMASGRYGFALFGWVPVSFKGRAKEAVDEFDSQTLHTFEPVDRHHEAERVPVMLENPGWVKPFESLVTFLNTPRYDGWDPTWMVASFLPLWFGMVVGDIGYALMFAALSWYLSGYIKRNQTLKVDFFRMRFSPGALRQVVAVLRPMIGWTVVWGFLHGEFFGNLLQHLGIFGTGQHPGLIQVLIPRTDTVATANLLILVYIGFGACQVLYGLYLKAFFSRRQGEKKHFWEASGYFSGVVALVLFAYAYMTRDFRLWLVIPIGMGSALFFVGMIRARMPLMVAELPTQAGHILSYIRLYAVGLASAILADLATEIALSLYHLLGVAGAVIGGLAGLLAGLLIHTVLTILLTMSHVLQPIRLIWVEFFSKFDFYMTRGRPYRPFKSISHS
jgi:V/A-type H+-transporting ATPase subunit I